MSKFELSLIPILLVDADNLQDIHFILYIQHYSDHIEFVYLQPAYTSGTKELPSLERCFPVKVRSSI